MLSRELVGIEIRQPQQAGSPKVHDAVEDALATREVLLTCVLQPDRLNTRARKTRAAFFRGTRQGRGRRQKCETQTGNISRNIAAERYMDRDEERLTWDDVVDPEIWPMSPPDSD